MQLAGRVALVTGAGRRLGRAIALALGDRGMRLAVHYNASSAGATEVVGVIRAAGGDAHAFQADLTDPAQIESLAAAVHGRFAQVDVLVNSAAVMSRTPFGETSAQDWDAHHSLNLRAPFLLTQALRRQLAAAPGGGAVINIADIVAFETWTGYVPHGVSKAGIVYLTRALARVMAPAVRVNAVAPGVVLLPENWDADSAARLERTTPLGRAGSPADVTSAVLFLLESDYITGEVIAVDGGRHVR
jgi:pteridine reductase